MQDGCDMTRCGCVCAILTSTTNGPVVHHANVSSPGCTHADIYIPNPLNLNSGYVSIRREHQPLHGGGKMRVKRLRKDVVGGCREPARKTRPLHQHNFDCCQGVHHPLFNRGMDGEAPKYLSSMSARPNYFDLRLLTRRVF